MIISIETMATIYMVNLGYVRGLSELARTRDRVTSYEGKQHWQKVHDHFKKEFEILQ